MRTTPLNKFKFDPGCMTQTISRVPIVGNSNQTREMAIKTVLKSRLDGDWVEFGVFTGGTARFFLRYLPENGSFSLFDSFEGLPEAWDVNHPKGHFSCEVPQFSDKRVEVIKGWFIDTIPKWVNLRTRPLSFIHIDSDIYSSARIVLMECNSLIVPGTIILFDEFYGYNGWQQHEYKAYREWLKVHGRKCQYLGRSSNHRLYLRVDR